MGHCIARYSYIFSVASYYDYTQLQLLLYLLILTQILSHMHNDENGELHIALI